MNYELRYVGRSSVDQAGGGAKVTFSPNLSRERVFFDSEVKNPVRFREAISALHAVVVGDLKYKKKDRTAWLEWKKAEAERMASLRAKMVADAKKDALSRMARKAPPPGLEDDFRKMHRLYWDARVRWANELARNDPEMFRHLVPCDPVVTVAPDSVFFECFSKDESSYGCLFVDRDAFKGDRSAGLGTTNVDYSLALYDHFQTLRTYRPTRLVVDPSGFEVKVESRSDYREEKIDLPPTWLRGFGQIQAAMMLPLRRVVLAPGAVYSALAYLVRHREKTGPRSIRVKLAPGKPPVLALDPWNVEISGGTVAYEGPREEEIKLWGRRRLMALERLLPLAERVEVLMLGSGLPSVWIVNLGEMRFLLALSGWTQNDWTSGTNLEVLAGDFRPDQAVMNKLSRHLIEHRLVPADGVSALVSAPEAVVLGSLHELAKQGQVLYDHVTKSYRWRPVMPVALSEQVLGPENPEVAEGRRAYAENQVKLEREERLPAGRRLLAGKVEGTGVEAIVDADGVLSKAKCSCSFFYKNRLKSGPCRHLLALRLFAADPRSARKGWLN